ncbi:hypothetical protein TrispH2_002492 [Trichoplax sp. H2]|nr:hypothetical protein TrispH2_002492 [Trichoplax sp. H2]|eukprot:RDD45220.1 hypothetical protein TrispH2_002492 [Trichoplax sp. H2]
MAFTELKDNHGQQKRDRFARLLQKQSLLKANNSHKQNRLYASTSNRLPPVFANNADALVSQSLPNNYNHNPVISLDSRIEEHEKTTSELIDFALDVQEDLVNQLNLIQATHQNSKSARTWLKDFIQAIATIVKRLSNTIEPLVKHYNNFVRTQQHKISNLQLNTQKDTFRVDNLIRSHQQIKEELDIIGTKVHNGHDQREELQSQVRRLKDELENQGRQIDAIRQNQSTNQNHVNQRLTKLEDEMNVCRQNLTEKKTTIQQLSQQLGEKDSLDDTLKHLDTQWEEKYTVIRQEAKDQTDHIKRWMTTEANQVMEFIRQAEVISNRSELRQNELEHQMVQIAKGLEKEVKQLIKQLQEQQTQFAQQQVQHFKKEQNTLIDKFRQECREGFDATHDNLATMRTMLETKQKILEGDLLHKIEELRLHTVKGLILT